MLIRDAAAKLKTLGNLETVREKKWPSASGSTTLTPHQSDRRQLPAAG
ncbi:MAG: hypothetical protein ABI868_08995 [Acidobacteriota bacterium]